ncbi:MAG: ATP-binding protein, partial [Anaerolineae bacterium]|nr:ATP-binding protein [Anaerolineae bacterium]
MSDYTPGIEAELRVSPLPILVVMPTLAALLFVGVQVLSCPWEVVSRAMSLLLLAGVLAIAGWLLVRKKPLLGRWFTVLAGLAMIHLLSVWLAIPAALVLVSVPVAFGVQLLGPRAALVAAAGESLLLVVTASASNVPPDLPTATLAIVGVWCALATVYAYYRPIRRLGGWLDEYLDRAHAFVEETRDRKMDLEHALENLTHANRQLGLANERAAALRRVAEDAQRAKTAFVANVSHEFRTPLNMIIGLVDLMVEAPEIYAVALSPKMREDLEVVHRNCEHLSSMINDVLDLTKIESGKFALHKERVDLGNLVDRAVQAVAPLADKKGLQLQLDIPHDLSDVYCDRVRIQQVIMNLVSNAARFTEQGGIVVRIAQEDQHVIVSVADTGPGIAPQDIDRVFEPFDQGGRGLASDTKGGSGLGLSISEHFLKLHGGHMWLESQQGVGTTFCFSLPVSPAIDHLAKPGHQMRADWVWRERSFRSGRVGSSEYADRPRVIVCDEDGALGGHLDHMAGEIEIIEVGDVAQAVQELRECPAHALLLNESNGSVMSRVLEETRVQAIGTPIIGCSVPKSLQRAADAGAMGYLVKPVTRADLTNALATAGDHIRRVLIADDDPEVRQ